MFGCNPSAFRFFYFLFRNSFRFRRHYQKLLVTRILAPICLLFDRINCRNNRMHRTNNNFYKQMKIFLIHDGIIYFHNESKIFSLELEFSKLNGLCLWCEKTKILFCTIEVLKQNFLEVSLYKIALSDCVNLCENSELPLTSKHIQLQIKMML